MKNNKLGYKDASHIHIYLSMENVRFLIDNKGCYKESSRTSEMHKDKQKEKTNKYKPMEKGIFC